MNKLQVERINQNQRRQKQHLQNVFSFRKSALVTIAKKEGRVAHYSRRCATQTKARIKTVYQHLDFLVLMPQKCIGNNNKKRRQNITKRRQSISPKLINQGLPCQQHWMCHCANSMAWHGSTSMLISARSFVPVACNYRDMNRIISILTNQEYSFNMT